MLMNEGKRADKHAFPLTAASPSLFVRLRKTPRTPRGDAHSQTLPDTDPYPQALLVLLLECLLAGAVSLPQRRFPCTRSYPWTAGRGSSAGQTAKEMMYGRHWWAIPCGAELILTSMCLKRRRRLSNCSPTPT